MDYGMTVSTVAPFAETADRVRKALKDQGFGVITEIDVQETLRDKIGAEIEDYLILGACNPALAHQALDADRQLGLLLPCNVVIRSGAGQTIVEAIDPQVMVEISGQPELGSVAGEASDRIRAALAAVGAD